MDTEMPRFVIARKDRRGELAITYLRNFALVGRHGLRDLAFGPADTAHLFDDRAEAEDIARKLRRRVAHAEYEYRAEEAVSAPPQRLAAFHWQ